MLRKITRRLRLSIRNRIAWIRSYKDRVLLYICLFELMIIGSLISFIETYHQLIIDAPTIGLTLILVSIVSIMFIQAAGAQ